MVSIKLFWRYPLLPFLRVAHCWLLGAAWTITQLLLYHEHGVRIVYDSHRYLRHARALAYDGVLVWDRNVLYVGYTALVAFFLKLGLPLPAVVLAQVLASGLAAVCLYQLSRHLTGRWLSAALATLAYVTWPDGQAWNFYIHTDAFFTSLLLIYSRLLLFPRAGWRRRLLLLWLLGWLLLLRPNGLIVGAATLSYCLMVLREKRPQLFGPVLGAATLGTLAALPFVAEGLLRNIFSLMEVYQSGSLFGGHPFMTQQPGTPLYLPSPELTPATRLVQFILHNPLYFARLFGLKLVVFFAQIKPYFSALHNAAIVLFMYPTYLLAVKGVLNGTVACPPRVFFLTLILVQATLAALTLPDWDNRFLAPLLPSIFLLAASAVFTGSQTLPSDHTHI